MKRIICFTLIAIFFASFNAQAQESVAKPAKKQKVAEITFESLDYDYGNIYKGDNGVCQFTFKNTGKAPLQITNCRASCGCTVPSWPKEPIAPGKKASFK